MFELEIKYSEKKFVSADNEADFEAQIEAIRNELQPNQEIIVAKSIIALVIPMETT